MARIVFCCELGNGYGHLTRFVPLALELTRRGHDVQVIGNDVARAARVLGPLGLALYQAPLWQARLAGAPPVCSYTDIALRFGYLDPVGLAGVARTWRHLLGLLQPDLLLLDHAPVALLATRGLGLPRLRFGDGFTCPPLAVPMPPIPSHATPPPGHAERVEATALHTANQVCNELGLPGAKSIAELLAADEDLLLTFAELDHYGPRANTRYWGPLLQGERGAEARWPAGTGARVFAYLRPEFPWLGALLKAMATAGVRALLHVPGLAAAARAQMPPALRFSEDPLAMRSVADQAELMICHGGYGSTHEALQRGLPMLVLPTQAEQTMLAQRVAAIGAGTLVRFPAPLPGRSASAPDLLPTLLQCLQQPGLRSAAQGYAQRHAGHGEQVASLLADRLEMLLR